MKKFFGIGDITTDAFITLLNARVHCNVNNLNCTLSMNFGDKIPFDSYKIVPGVGNSMNACVSASRLGLESFAVTNVGDDENGRNCLNVLKDEKVNTSYSKIHPKLKTNFHFVLSYEAERTILIKHEDYKYTLPEFDSVPDFVYLSSVGENLSFLNNIGKYCKKNNVKLVFQPGTFQLNTAPEKLNDVYKNTHIFACNVEESQKILKTQNSDIKFLLEGVKNLGPKIVLITDGPKGAYSYDGLEYLFCPAYPDPKPPVERTGAGDSFTSTFVSLYAKGGNIHECLLRAPINSMSVVQYTGAQKGLLTEEKIEEHFKKAPAYYKIKVL